MEKDKNRIRVCQVWNYYPPLFAGGALRYNQLTPLLNALEVDITVLTPQWKGLCSEETINNARILRLSTGPFQNRILQRLFAGMSLVWYLLVRSKAHDILHAVSEDIFFVPAYLLAKFMGIPVIIDFTIMSSKEQSVTGKLVSRFNAFVFQFLDAYIGNSSPLITQMQNRGLVPLKCHLISNGVFTDQFKPLGPEQRKKLRSELGLKENSVYLLFVGNFLERKGVDILVQTMLRLHNKLNNIYLFVIGKHSFPENSRGQQFAEDQKRIICTHSLDTSITFLGLLDHSEYLRWLQASDIFVFPSRREGLSRAVLEAMSAGLPCVCSPIDGVIYDVFEPNVSGVVVEDCQPDTFASQIQRLAANRPLRESIGSKARQRAIERFDEKQIVSEFKQLYKELLK